MHVMIIIMILSSVIIVEKSLSMKPIDSTTLEKNMRKRWRDVFTKANTNMKTNLHLHKMKLIHTQEILGITYNFKKYSNSKSIVFSES